jgi:hypothetical protein
VLVEVPAGSIALLPQPSCRSEPAVGSYMVELHIGSVRYVEALMTRVPGVYVHRRHAVLLRLCARQWRQRGKIIAARSEDNPCQCGQARGSMRNMWVGNKWIGTGFAGRAFTT